ncbi:MAG TPA: hypothetical protein VES70_33595 [Pseudomonas sp.]|nr:hypothetical protein [Pseudomonas sp.]
MNNKSFSDLITFTRATTGTWLNPATGLLETAAINVPRLEAKGLLFEQQRTNLALRSADFGNATWVKSQLTVTTDGTLSPDGVTQASKLVPSTVAAGHQISQNIASTATAFAASVFAKAGAYNILRVRIAINGTFSGDTIVNLTTGAIVSTGFPGSYTEQMPNGWWRVVVPFSAVSTTTVSFGFWVYVNGNGTDAGDGTSALYTWGAQLEAADSVSSYIPTVAAQVTRSADLAYVLAADWLREGEGTLFVETQNRSVLSVLSAMLGTSASNPRISLLLSSTSLSRAEIVNDANVTQFGLNLGSVQPQNGILKQAIGYKADSVAQFSSQGLATSEVGPVVLPTIDRLTLGTRAVNIVSSHMTGHIRRIKYFPYRLTAAELQALTT